MNKDIRATDKDVNKNMVAEDTFWQDYSQQIRREQKHSVEVKVGSEEVVSRVGGSAGGLMGTRGWLWLKLWFKRRPYFTIAAIIITFITFATICYQVILLISKYHEYILALLPQSPLPLQMRSHHKDANKIKEGATDVRILCLIFTAPKYHKTRAQHVAVTWAKHCTKALFLTTQSDPLLPTLITPRAETYDQLWDKVTQGFEWAYDHREDYDWVFKADDDTFALVENLQAGLRGLDPTHPAATGVHLRTWDTGSTYLNGGAGYVLSRGAVTRLVERGLRGRVCQDNINLGTLEDVNMANCLTYLGIELLDSRDSWGRQRFHIYPPEEVLDPRQANSLTHLWLKQISVYPYKFGYSELSDEVISFHYVDGNTMYLLYYLIYVLNPRGDNTQTSPLQQPKNLK